VWRTLGYPTRPCRCDADPRFLSLVATVMVTRVASHKVTAASLSVGTLVQHSIVTRPRAFGFLVFDFLVDSLRFFLIKPCREPQYPRLHKRFTGSYLFTPPQNRSPRLVIIALINHLGNPYPGQNQIRIRFSHLRHPLYLITPPALPVRSLLLLYLNPLWIRLRSASPGAEKRR